MDTVRVAWLTGGERLNFKGAVCMGVLGRAGCGLAGIGVVLALGVSAPGASAYYISGGIYGGDPTGDPTLTIGAYSVECPAAVSHNAGNAWGVAWTTFSSFYGGTEACEFFGFPATVTASGDQTLTITSGPSGMGLYQGSLSIPTATTTTYSVPIAGCTVTVSGPQTFAHGAGGNVVTAWNTTPTGMLVAIAVGSVDFTASGCPFSSGSSGELSSSFHAPGVTISH